MYTVFKLSGLESHLDDIINNNIINLSELPFQWLTVWLGVPQTLDLIFQDEHPFFMKVVHNLLGRGNFKLLCFIELN